MPFIAIGIGFLIARNMNRNRAVGDKVRWPIYIAGGLAMMYVLVKISNPSPNTSDTSRLVIQTVQGVKSDMHQSADEYTAEELDAYAATLTDDVNSQIGDPLTKFAGDTIAIVGELRPILRTNIYSETALINRIYTSSIDGQIVALTCYYANATPLTPSDIVECQNSALTAFGAFSEVDRNG